LLAFLVGSLFLPGCGWVGRPAGLFGGKSRGAEEAAVAEMGGPPVDAVLLQGGEWTHAQPDPRLLSDPALPRWRHSSLEPMFALPPTERPNLLVALELPDAPVRTNAAIGLARWGDGRGFDVLVTTVNEPQLRLSLREAAVEALGNLTKPSPVAALRKAIDTYGRFEVARAQTYSPELHVDLLRALSRHVDAADDTRFTEALQAPTMEPRREALAAWARSKTPELPAAVVDLRADPAVQIRAAAITMLLERRHPQAIEFAGKALQDYEPDVRDAAVVGLGRHGGPEARAALDRVMIHEGEVLRASVVAAYEQMGAFDAVLAASNDKAWRVRRAVARSLSRRPDPQAAATLRTFLTDDSGEVRKATVAALDNWSLPAAGPVLLTALAEPTYETRKLACEQLARRWPPAKGLSADLPPDRRREAIAVLEAQWTNEFGPLDRVVLAGASSPYATNVGPIAAPIASGPPPLTPERLDRLQLLVAEAARPDSNVVSLDTFGPDVVDGLERLVVERGAVLPEVVYKQILPPKDGAFAALERLTSSDVNDRRRAADRLAETAATAPLRPLVVARIVELGIKESDAIVWHGLFAALQDDGGPTAVGLALAGLSHPSPEVRRMACEHLGRSPRPQHAALLIRALGDPHVSVMTEALKSLAHTGMLNDPAPVERLLNERDPAVRLAAAVALKRNGLPQGAAALERLAHDADSEIRRRAAVAMGESYDVAFVPTLVELLSDEALGPRKAAVENLVKLVGKDVSVRPGEPTPSLADRAALWRAWYEQTSQAANRGANALPQ
jgi:HEAT repeat protein